MHVSRQPRNVQSMRRLAAAAVEAQVGHQQRRAGGGQRWQARLEGAPTSAPAMDQYEGWQVSTAVAPTVGNGRAVANDEFARHKA
eukprot:354212-Chlamydomonas_euryale.AAC.7